MYTRFKKPLNDVNVRQRVNLILVFLKWPYVSFGRVSFSNGHPVYLFPISSPIHHII